MKKAIFILAIVISIFIINGLVRSIYDIWSKRDLIASSRDQLEAEKRENERLKAQLEEAQKSEFIEEQARNKLLLVQPGEQTVLVPEDIATESADEEKPDTRSNWQKWWDLFF